MHFQKVGKRMKAKKRYEVKQYLSTRMGLLMVLMDKYGIDSLKGL